MCSVNVCLLLVALLAAEASACYWNDRFAYSYFGTKTPYDDVRGDLRDFSALNDCEPISVWFMMRHGTRLPGSNDIKNMKSMLTIKNNILKSHAEGRGELCAQDVTNLKKWEWKDAMDTMTAAALTDEGYQELLELGSRFHEKFHSLLEQLDEYHFRPSSEQRTILSSKAFTKGLGQNSWVFNVSDPLEKDDVARPYKHCDKRKNEVTEGPLIQNQLNKYYETQEFKQLLTAVRKRIGLDQELTPLNVSSLYGLCRFYRAYTATRKDPWCALFSNHDLEIMEYTEDISHYYRNSYGGGSVNVKLGEMALKDLFEKFQSADSVKRMIGYFTHDTMLMMVYSALGLYNDYPEVSGFERVKSRQWRSSFSAPFAANFVAVLNRCNNIGVESLKVQFFVNEHELHLCNARACDWEDFIKKFKVFANSDLEFCTDDTKMRNHA